MSVKRDDLENRPTGSGEVDVRTAVSPHHLPRQRIRPQHKLPDRLVGQHDEDVAALFVLPLPPLFDGLPTAVLLNAPDA